MELYRRPAPWGLELSGFGRPMGLGRDAQGCWLVTDMDCHVLWRLDAAIERFQWHAGTAEGWSETILPSMSLTTRRACWAISSS